ncbi:putative hydrolase or acyltransferase of alpha/beta superfamily [Linnemannia elongata]|nr:putative hydrolase or acyltransferase of alpha/beta superfamily [Linnemannia elongata]
MARFSKSLRLFFVATLLTTTLFAVTDAANKPKPSKKVNIVLAHGALADGSSWSRVIPHLHAAGHHVIAVQQPLTSIEDDVAKVKAALGTIKSGPIVLVGHSFGGTIISEAAHNNSNVSALVYVAAFAADQGESVAEIGKSYTPLPSNQAFDSDSQGRLILPQDLFVKYFAPDVELKEAKIMAAAQGPFDNVRFGFVSGPPAWKEHPSYYIIAEDDQIIQPEMQAFFARRMKAKKTVKVPASHALLISRSKEVTDLILEAARAVAK